MFLVLPVLSTCKASLLKIDRLILLHLDKLMIYSRKSFKFEFKSFPSIIENINNIYIHIFSNVQKFIRPLLSGVDYAMQAYKLRNIISGPSFQVYLILLNHANFFNFKSCIIKKTCSKQTIFLSKRKLINFFIQKKRFFF